MKKSREIMKKARASIELEQFYWNQGFAHVVGIDEAGRGPLAGPVVVAACTIDPNAIGLDSDLLQDSKKLNPKKLEKAFNMLTKSSDVHYSISIIDHVTIDKVNILQATLMGMDQVIEEMGDKCQVVLIDGNILPPKAKKEFTGPMQAIVNGDAEVRVIAAASILAKVTRDRIMLEYHKQYPQYHFDKNKGYPTKQHREAVRKYGRIDIHRKTFKIQIDCDRADKKEE